MIIETIKDINRFFKEDDCSKVEGYYSYEEDTLFLNDNCKVGKENLNEMKKAVNIKNKSDKPGQMAFMKI